MRFADKVAVIALLAIMAGGGWLVAAPFVLHYQSGDAPWTRGTRIDVWFGVGLVALALITVTGYAVAGLRELVEKHAKPGKHSADS